MSFAINDTLVIFNDPTSVPLLPPGSNPNSVDATKAPVQLGGSNKIYTLTPGATPTAPQQVVLSGSNNRLNIPSGSAKIQAIGGGQIIESVDVAGDFGKLIKLNDVNPTKPDEEYNRSVVDKNSSVSGNTANDTLTINQAAGGQGGDFAYYAKGGAGDDTIVGSFQADFLRGGAGNDIIFAHAGNDLIRGGAGSDRITGDEGNDTLYYTSDQLDGSTDTFADFATGVDKISIDKTSISNLSQISGLGTNTIVFAGGTTLISLGSAINSSDITLI
jgi:Ca2+-binding RTX toxin-like protein